MIETNTETINDVDNNYLNDDKIATVISNTVPSLTDNYIWMPGTTDNVVLGLDSLFMYSIKICDISSITEFNNQHT